MLSAAQETRLRTHGASLPAPHGALQYKTEPERPAGLQPYKHFLHDSELECSQKVECVLRLPLRAEPLFIYFCLVFVVAFGKLHTCVVDFPCFPACRRPPVVFCPPLAELI